MEWMGFVCLAILLYYSSYPKKVKQLESRIKKLERLEKLKKEEKTMSRIINELIGKNCKIKSEDIALLSGRYELDCYILDTDDEWFKFTYKDNKNIEHIKILKIEQLESIELLSEPSLG